MFDFGLILLGGLASAGTAALLGRQWQRQRLARHLRDFPVPDAELPKITAPDLSISVNGWLQVSAPQVPGPRQTFTEIFMADGALCIQTGDTAAALRLPLRVIQWISPVELLEGDHACLHLHVVLGRTWRILSLSMPEADMLILVSVLRRAIPLSRSSLGSAPFRPLGPIPARIASQTWQGEMFGGPEIELYLLPHWLVVLLDDQVEARLALSSLRRVLAVERKPSWSDRLTRHSGQAGLMHLYSMSESISFLLPQYRELAEEIGLLAPCQVELVSAQDKRQKR